MTAVEAAEKLRMQVIDALDRLPNTAQGIADYFTEVGIKASPEYRAGARALHCPITQYVKAETDASSVGTDQGLIIVWAPTFADVNVGPFPHVGEFIDRMDNDEWPHLIDRSEQ